MLAHGKIRYNLNLFVNSFWCPILMALFVLSANFYSGLPYIYFILCIFSAFSLAFMKNIRVLLLSVLFIRLCNFGNYDLYSKASWILAGVACGILVICYIYYLLCGIKSTTNFKTGTWFWGIVFAFFGAALGGILNSYYVDNYFSEKIIVIVGLGLLILFLYLGLVNFLNTDPNTIQNLWDKTPKNIPNYISSKNFKRQTNIEFLMTAIILCAVIIGFAVIEFYASCDDVVAAILSKKVRINGKINSYAPFLFFGVIGSAYFAAKEKKSLPWLFLMAMFFLLTIFTYSRAVIFISAICLPFVVAYSWIKSKNKKIFAYNVLIVLIFFVVLLILMQYFVVDVFGWIKKLGFSTNGREFWWNLAVEKFKDNPIFGIGLWGDETGLFTINDKLWWFHNTILQMLACFGIIGSLFCILYYIQKYYILIKHRSFSNAYIFMIIVFIAGHGMIDIVSFNIEIVALTIILMAFVETEPIAEKEPFGINLKRVGIMMAKNHKEKHKNTLNKSKCFYNAIVKRFFDLCFSGLCLLIFSPIILIVAVLVRIKLGGPVIFAQIRPGKNNKIFKLYKFRTMTNERDAEGNLLPDEQRMTKFGNALRKTSLDELPQLWNIFKGDMSLIGPRPKLVKDMVFYNDEQNIRAKVRPGLTGLAQVNGRNNATWEEIFAYDKQYVEHLTLWQDTKIFFKTIGKVIKKADIVEQNQTKQNYYFGDYLLETNQISQEEYAEKQQKAIELINEVKEKKNKKRAS